MKLLKNVKNSFTKRKDAYSEDLEKFTKVSNVVQKDGIDIGNIGGLFSYIKSNKSISLNWFFGFVILLLIFGGLPPKQPGSPPSTLDDTAGLNEATIEVNSAVETISVESKEKSLEIQDVRQSNANTLDAIMNEMDAEETITPVVERRSVIRVDNPRTQEKTIIIRDVEIVTEIKEVPSEDIKEPSKFFKRNYNCKRRKDNYRTA